MRCTSCNEATRVLETRQRPDGATRRRRECRSCGRRFTTDERPDAEWLGELAAIGQGISGPFEAVRRKAILAAARDENDRVMAEAIDRLFAIAAAMGIAPPKLWAQ